MFFLLLSSGLAANDEEERKLLSCLRKSMLSPYKKQVIQLPSDSVASGHGKLTPPRQIEIRSLTSPRIKGLVLKRKQSPCQESTSKTRSSPRRSTPSKCAGVVRTRTSTPLRKTKRIRADVRKKTGFTPRRTPSKKQSLTPRKSAKRTPAKGVILQLLSHFCM